MATPVRRSWGEPTLCGRKPEYQQSTLNPFLPEKLRCGDVPFFCYVLPSSHESLARSVSWWVCALREAPAGSLQYILTEAQHQAQVTKPVPRSQRPRFQKTPSLTRLSEWKHENRTPGYTPTSGDRRTSERPWRLLSAALIFGNGSWLFPQPFKDQSFEKRNCYLKKFLHYYGV